MQILKTFMKVRLKTFIHVQKTFMQVRLKTFLPVQKTFMQVQKTFMQLRLKTFMQVRLETFNTSSENSNASSENIYASSENIYANTIENIYVCSENINPFHAFPGPGSGILILTTMPIPDRVWASLQLIGYSQGPFSKFLTW